MDSKENNPTISVIIPVYNEAGTIDATLNALQKMRDSFAVEIIVVDGDANSSTISAISHDNTIKMSAPKGRALQMNAGAAKARGDILLFLHADTILPDGAFDDISGAMTSGQFVAGAFNISIPKNRPLLRFNYYTSYLRSRLTGIPYGDQAIFIRKEVFNKFGGYPEIPLMEEVALMKLLKKNKLRVIILKNSVKTSTRRYDQDGFLFGLLRNNAIRFLYLLGVSPHRLAKLYPDTRDK
ncbi:MAG: glycosyltransferase family 2 protein [bacterium]|nr:glycosyltransferase family 2 protein [bacterium]